MTKSWMLISPQSLKFGTWPEGGVVLVQMDYYAAAVPWLAPDISLALEFTPGEAVAVANHLILKAKEVEGINSDR
jgi:hypothetical protein